MSSSTLLRAFDLKNPHSLRILASALDYWCAGGRDQSNDALSKLSPRQLNNIQTAVELMEESPLVSIVIHAFLAAPRAGNGLVEPARDIEDYLVPQAFEPRTNTSAYREAASAWFNRKPIRSSNSTPYYHRQLAATPTGNAIQSSSSTHYQPTQLPAAQTNAVAPLTSAGTQKISQVPKGKLDDMEKDSAPEIPATGPKHARLRIEHTSGSLTQSSTKPPCSPGRVHSSQNFTPIAKIKVKETEEQLEQIQSDEAYARALQESNEKSSVTTSGSGTPVANGKKKNNNRPKRTAFDRPVAEGCDREPARLGVVDRSKLKIHFDTVRDDPKHEGRVIPGNPVDYDWFENHGEVDFNNVKDVRAINTWRRQIFLRNFDPVRKTRAFWLVSEKQKLLGLASAQIDRHGYIKWNRLANSYNLEMNLAGVIQRKGEVLVGQSQRHTDGMREDREAPWRTRSAIYGQSERWEEFKDLMNAALPTVQDVDDEELLQNDENDENEANVLATDSGDDVEIPDPNPGPRRSGGPVPKRKRPAPRASTISKAENGPVRRNAARTTRASRPSQKMMREESDEEEGEDEDMISLPSTGPRTGHMRGYGDDDKRCFFPNLYKKELGGIDRRK